MDQPVTPVSNHRPDDIETRTERPTAAHCEDRSLPNNHERGAGGSDECLQKVAAAQRRRWLLFLAKRIAADIWQQLSTPEVD